MITLLVAMMKHWQIKIHIYRWSMEIYQSNSARVPPGTDRRFIANELVQQPSTDTVERLERHISDACRNLDIFPTWVFPKIMGKAPKSSILIGFSIINHPFWGFSPFLETPTCACGVVNTIKFDMIYKNHCEPLNVTDNISRSCCFSHSLSPKCICVLCRAFPKSKHISPQIDHFQS